MIVRDLLGREFEAIKLGGMWADLPATNGTGAPATVSDPVLNAIRYYRVMRKRVP